MSSVFNVRFPAPEALEIVSDCDAVVPHGILITRESLESEPPGALPTVMFMVVVSLL